MTWHAPRHAPARRTRLPRGPRRRPPPSPEWADALRTSANAPPGPPAWSIGRCETSSSRFAQESHHTGLRASDGMDEASVVVPVSGPQRAPPHRCLSDLHRQGHHAPAVGRDRVGGGTCARPFGQGLFAVAYVEPAARSTRRPWPDDGESVLHGPTAGRPTADQWATRCGSPARPRPRRRGRSPQAGGAGHRGGLGWTPLLVTLAGIPGALAALFLQGVLLGEGGWSPTTRSTSPRRR